jgi:hypothetical protein
VPDFRVADTAPEHPKLRAAGLAAFGLWSAAGAYAMRELTDGWVPEYWVTTWPAGKRAAGTLVSVGLWSKEPRNGLPGYQFHDWEDYQRSAKQIEAERAEGRERARRSRERGRTFGERSGERNTAQDDPCSDHVPNLVRSYHSVTPESLPASETDRVRSEQPLPAETADRSAERSANVRGESHDSLSLTRALSSGYLGGEGAGRVRGDAQAPPRPRCQRHSQLPPDADVPPCRACQQLRIESERQVADNVLGELAARNARRAAIDACGRCDDNGMRETDSGVARCTHGARLEAVS